MAAAFACARTPTADGVAGPGSEGRKLMTTPKARLGLVGLGLMGSAMAARLCDRGYPLAGFDIAADKLRAAGDRGVEPAGSAAAVAAAADVVLISVTGMPALEAALFATDGILAGARPGQIIIDTSTSDGAATRDWAARIRAEHDVDWIDAPVSGGPPAAAAGTLAIMAGGEAAVLARVRPVLEDLGQLSHMGPVGAGQATKMVNQVLVLTNYCVLAEALKLAEKAGVDAARIPRPWPPAMPAPTCCAISSRACWRVPMSRRPGCPRRF